MIWYGHSKMVWTKTWLMSTEVWLPHPKFDSLLWDSIIFFAVSMKTAGAISVKIWNQTFLGNGPQFNVGNTKWQNLNILLKKIFYRSKKITIKPTMIKNIYKHALGMYSKKPQCHCFQMWYHIINDILYVLLSWTDRLFASIPNLKSCHSSYTPFWSNLSNNKHAFMWICSPFMNLQHLTPLLSQPLPVFFCIF